MPLQFSVAVRNARLDAIESTIGASAVLKVFQGAIPANCAAADVGTVLSTVSLPADWMGAASAGAKALAGLWQDTAADNTGTAQYFRMYDSTGTTCHTQGTITLTAGGGDMTVDNTSFVAGQQYTVTSYTINEPNG